MKSKERSLLHVVHLDGRHAAGGFCKYDGVEAGGLIRGHENRGRDERNGEKRKRRGGCGRGARRRRGDVRWESTRDLFCISLPQR